MLIRITTVFVSVAGIPAEKLVEAHGTFSTATCTICRNKVDGSQIKVSDISYIREPHIMHQK